MSDNPYAPPESPLPPQPEPAKSLWGPLYFLVLASFAAYCIGVESLVDMLAIKDQLAEGVVPALPVLCFLIGSASMLIGVGRHMYAPWQGKQAFILTAAALGIGLVASVQHGGYGYLNPVFLLGMAIGLFGAWAAHRALQIVIAEYMRQKDGAAE